MIPLHLRIAGFLSYRDPVDLDFSRFDIACISGQNGAGKSSLLDAITWALFGQARKRDDSLVNLQSKTAEVVFDFSYESNVYRIVRGLPRGKTTTLEFQVAGDGSGDVHQPGFSLDELNWRPLTERTTRDTQARIESILRLDYDTFINAAFFLQGKADQFTQQTAAKRKDVLSNILGLEIWETYRERVAVRRNEFEDQVRGIDGRMSEIEAELAEEAPRKERLKELETELKRLSLARKTQEVSLENIKKTVASLDQQSKLVETLASGLERSAMQLVGLQNRLVERESARAVDADLLDRAREIEAAYRAWQKARAELEEWEKTASKFREHEKDRTPLLEQIAAEKARLEEEQRALILEQQEIENQAESLNSLKAEIENAQKSLKEAESKIGQRLELENQKNEAQQRQAELKTENDLLKVQMDELKERIDQLEAAEGATCPLCGQPLSKEHRKSTLKQLQAEGKEKGNRFRANKSRVEQLTTQALDYEAQLAKLTEADNERLAHSNEVSRLTERMERLQSLAKDWSATGKKRLAEINKILEKETYAPEAHRQLARLDKQLAKLGYDASSHDSARKAEAEGRAAEEAHNLLEKAHASSKAIEEELANLREQIDDQQAVVEGQQADYESAAAALAAAHTQAPDLDESERAYEDLLEQENNLRNEVGMAQQRVNVLEDRRKQKINYAEERESLALQIARHKTLERAFGKDGVPALLIEQALPQIESKANELLDRLSDGQMSIRFVTQAEYKDKKREDLKETLGIQISDTAGVRDYEMYSGGEAFRVNFAVRLALSEVLAQRKGARLQTLVIDEGFASQDAQGRQRLIEAINLVKGDFAKILVITHLDELKDAFPTRIEVEKTERGSTVQVI